MDKVISSRDLMTPAAIEKDRREAATFQYREETGQSSSNRAAATSRLDKAWILWLTLVEIEEG
jgi:hypothetical protein